MTHTLNRRGLDESRRGEEICVLCMIHYKCRNEQTVDAMKDIARIVLSHGPNNFMGAPLGVTLELAIELSATSGILTAVFTDKEEVGRLVQEIKAINPGISVVLSGLFSDIRDICKSAGLTEHTTNYALGIFGNKTLLPDHLTLEIVTQCGHGLVSRHYVKHVVLRIREGKMTIKEGADLLSKPCVCGIVNRKRTEEILATMVEQGLFKDIEINYAVRQMRTFA